MLIRSSLRGIPLRSWLPRLRRSMMVAAQSPLAHLTIAKEAAQQEQQPPHPLLELMHARQWTQALHQLNHTAQDLSLVQLRHLLRTSSRCLDQLSSSGGSTTEGPLPLVSGLMDTVAMHPRSLLTVQQQALVVRSAAQRKHTLAYAQRWLGAMRRQLQEAQELGMSEDFMVGQQTVGQLGHALAVWRPLVLAVGKHMVLQGQWTSSGVVGWFHEQEGGNELEGDSSTRTTLQLDPMGKSSVELLALAHAGMDAQAETKLNHLLDQYGPQPVLVESMLEGLTRRKDPASYTLAQRTFQRLPELPLRPTRGMYTSLLTLTARHDPRPHLTLPLVVSDMQRNWLAMDRRLVYHLHDMLLHDRGDMVAARFMLNQLESSTTSATTSPEVCPYIVNARLQHALSPPPSGTSPPPSGTPVTHLATEALHMHPNLLWPRTCDDAVMYFTSRRYNPDLAVKFLRVWPAGRGFERVYAVLASRPVSDLAARRCVDAVEQVWQAAGGGKEGRGGGVVLEARARCLLRWAGGQQQQRLDDALRALRHLWTTQQQQQLQQGTNVDQRITGFILKHKRLQ